MNNSGFKFDNTYANLPEIMATKLEKSDNLESHEARGQDMLTIEAQNH